jgi:hypothetical protein
MWRHRHWGRTVHHGGRRPGVGLGPRPLVPSAFPPCYSSPCCFLQTHATSRTGTARESSSGRSMRGERQSRGVWWPGPGVAQTRPAAVHVAHCLPTSQSPLCLCACGNFPGGCSFEETNTASRIEFLGRIWHHERCLLTLVLVYIAHRMGSV